MHGQEWQKFQWIHPMQSRAQGMPVVCLPLFLFCDDTSGNRTKKWNAFDMWYLLLGGLSKEDNAQLKNIHFLTCSNRVSALELAKPLVADLLKLERGVPVYDAHLKKNVLVVAPLLCLLADNPRASELLCHLGTTANCYCRICQVSISK